ncbi:hypothetical protein DMB66_29485 [Actinoplanes sp. ATCC 53533]|uniref:hypothetical protein n=1 Tax=Actinoplanes sp. ATCC 53533 TaxID=1288362 RepID=UPI000F792911|nr:hypothetical protein [Actinoplanes sp. ATCC 53533]RSM58403.1 hypothetical protein DMB66_29485 [Actinoplanes sp. ATCC 53533]
MRRRTAIPGTRLTARHVGGRIVVLPRLAPRPPARKVSRAGPVTVTVAVAALIVCVTLLLNGVEVAPPRAEGPCPARTSVTAVAGGHSLQVRREQTDDFTALVHLCASSSLGPVRSWSIGVDAPARAAASVAGPVAGTVAGPLAGTVAVQRLGDRLALAIAPMAADRRATLTVTTVPRTGPPITFLVDVAVG